jgi:hypothetical protein
MYQSSLNLSNDGYLLIFECMVVLAVAARFFGRFGGCGGAGTIAYILLYGDAARYLHFFQKK